MATMQLAAIETACAAINMAGRGRVNWRRKTTSRGSGTVRLKGRFDGYDVSRATISPVDFRGTIHMMLVIVLTEAQIAENVENGGSDKPTRNINLGTVLKMTAG